MVRFAFYEKVSDSSTQKYVLKKKKTHFMTFSGPCRANIFPCQDFPCRAVPIFFRAMIFRAVPCHKSAGPPFRAVPGRPCQRCKPYLSQFAHTSNATQLDKQFGNPGSGQILGSPAHTKSNACRQMPNCQEMLGFYSM